jgi:hypothetical protein
MPPKIPFATNVLACKRGSTLVGYSSLVLQVVIAAITLVTKPDVDAGNDPHRRTIGAAYSD